MAKLFPEIDQLFGVPNPEQWHPEIDTGIHSLMVLEQAARLTKDSVTRFAALMHDLGKGVTPKEFWPSHPGHEEKGVTLIQNLCKRIAVPREYQDLAVLTARFHGNCHRAFELNATTLLKMLEQLDAFRRPERFQQFLTACEADSKGRTGFENRPYPQREFMYNAYLEAAKISAQPFIEQGYAGAELGNKLHEARVHALKKIIAQRDANH